MRLTATKVKALKDPGRYGDGTIPGLYLVVRPSGSKAWIQRIVIDGRRRDIGLGGYPDVSLARAHEKARENRSAVADGRDPQAEKRQPLVPTFRVAAEATIAANAPRWRNGKTATNWRGQMETYTYPVFGDVRVDRVERADVLSVLSPVWTLKPSAAKKLRQRIKAVFGWAMGARVHRGQPRRRGYRRCTPAHAGGQGALPSPAVPGSGRSPRRRGCFGGVLVVQVLLPLPGADGCTQWRGQGRDVG